MTNKELKDAGEAAAEDLLRNKGMQTLDRNWRCRLGELDLIALDGSCLVFVEVKARSSARFADPAAAVNARKQARLRRLAEVYLAARRPVFEECRFDVVTVLADGSGRLSVTHIPAAF